MSKADKKLLRELLSSAPRNGSGDHYDFGFEYLGPSLYGLGQWLYKSVLESGCRKVFFFSRDGYMMEKAFDIFNKDKSIETNYVYFSRRSLRGALLHMAGSYGESLKYLHRSMYVSVGELLEYFGFLPEERAEILEKHSLDADEFIPYDKLAGDRRMENVYREYRNAICERSLRQDELLGKYIVQTGMSGKCAAADIGWFGNMQLYLEEYIRLKGMDISICGFYAGISPTAPLSGSCAGYLFDGNDMTMKKDVMGFIGVYERLFQSCEGSATGYEERGGEVVPRQAEFEYRSDEHIIKSINEWQQGAMDFAERAYEAGAAPSDPKSWSRPLVKLGKSPTNAQVKLFSHLYNADGTKVYYTSQKPLYKYGLKELAHALGSSPWKPGFMRSLFKLPLPYYGIYRLLKKIVNGKRG